MVSSDKASENGQHRWASDLRDIAQAGSKSGGKLVYADNGMHWSSDLRNIAESGGIVISSDKASENGKTRWVSDLRDIAKAGSKNKGKLVYIDDGRLWSSDLRDIAGSGGIVISSDNASENGKKRWVSDLRDIAREGLKNGGRLIYIDSGNLSSYDLNDLARAGATIIPSDSVGGAGNLIEGVVNGDGRLVNLYMMIN